MLDQYSAHAVPCREFVTLPACVEKSIADANPGPHPFRLRNGGGFLALACPKCRVLLRLLCAAAGAKLKLMRRQTLPGLIPDRACRRLEVPELTPEAVRPVPVPYQTASDRAPLTGGPGRNDRASRLVAAETDPERFASAASCRRQSGSKLPHTPSAHRREGQHAAAPAESNFATRPGSSHTGAQTRTGDCEWLCNSMRRPLTSIAW